MRLRSIFSLAFVLATASVLAHASDEHAGSIQVTQSYARATVPNQPSGAAYLTLENKGSTADKLVAASSPVAKSVEIHTMAMEGNMMRMREVQNFELKPAEKIEMKPGDGYHVMLIGLRQPLKAGDRFPLTLTFEKAGKTEVSVVVQERKDSSPRSH